MLFKKILLSFSVFIFVFSFLGCSQKDRLSTNTMTLSIEPKPDFTVNVGGDPYYLSAVVRNSKNEVIDEPVYWSVSNSSIGVFSNSTSKNTSFIGASAGTAVITLTCQGIQTSVTVTVN
ncbi:MAG: hypothetical protein AB7E39_00550 [Endomicrobiaceae bacterium]